MQGIPAVYISYVQHSRNSTSGTGNSVVTKAIQKCLLQYQSNKSHTSVTVNFLVLRMLHPHRNFFVWIKLIHCAFSHFNIKSCLVIYNECIMFSSYFISITVFTAPEADRSLSQSHTGWKQGPLTHLIRVE